jgi:hypothetical protein
MVNNYGIPDAVEQRVRSRNRHCVYCHKKMIAPFDQHRRGDSATIEHLDESGPAYWYEGLKERGLAMCCGGCNSSRRDKSLRVWFKSDYCLEKNISKNTVAKCVRKYV